MLEKEVAVWVVLQLVVLGSRACSLLILDSRVILSISKTYTFLQAMEVLLFGLKFLFRVKVNA